MRVRLLSFSFLISLSQASVVSLDLCADQWVLGRAPRDQIFSVSYLAPDPILSYFSAKAEGLKIHHGKIEELLDKRIKMVVATDVINPFFRKVLEKRGVKVIILKSPRTQKELEEQDIFLRALFNQKLGFKKNSTSQKKLTRTAIFYGVGGLTSGRKTLLNDALEESGYKNGFNSLKGWGYVGLEQVLNSKAEVIFLLGEETSYVSSLFWKSIAKRKKIVVLPQRLTMCPCPEAYEDLKTLLGEVKN